MTQSVDWFINVSDGTIIQNLAAMHTCGCSAMAELWLVLMSSLRHKFNIRHTAMMTWPPTITWRIPRIPLATTSNRFVHQPVVRTGQFTDSDSDPQSYAKAIRKYRTYGLAADFCIGLLKTALQNFKRIIITDLSSPIVEDRSAIRAVSHWLLSRLLKTTEDRTVSKWQQWLVATTHVQVV